MDTGVIKWEEELTSWATFCQFVLLSRGAAGDNLSLIYSWVNWITV